MGFQKVLKGYCYQHHQCHSIRSITAHFMLFMTAFESPSLEWKLDSTVDPDARTAMAGIMEHCLVL